VPTVKTDELRKYAETFLLPFFSGAEIEEGINMAKKGAQQVAWINAQRIAFKIYKRWKRRLVLRRSQAFAKEKDAFVTERRVVESFVKSFREILPALDEPYRDDVLASLQRRIVVKSIADEDLEPTLVSTLDQFTSFASCLYEGRPISLSVGFVSKQETVSPTLFELWKHDFGSILGNGIDTIVVANQSGHLVEHTNQRIKHFTMVV